MIDDWQPIETAPRDGSLVLVWPPTWDGHPAPLARWEPEEFKRRPRPYWRRNDDVGLPFVSRNNPPTHWRPIPAVLLRGPQEDQRDGGE